MWLGVSVNVYEDYSKNCCKVRQMAPLKHRSPFRRNRHDEGRSSRLECYRIFVTYYFSLNLASLLFLNMKKGWGEMDFIANEVVNLCKRFLFAEW